ncbi:UDP-N-acetylmuramoyl-L-alanyl-D-glutamate--2,6-diaminopimelate ligase [Pseudoclavibacter sp. JAI123]|uniref:Mur ligase family protein n=1 Tax=Pseudoclavibacter sp. JAI123 TaxID=2723065 RepID=UPI0015C6D59A|nr:UDP-N-acetylmuramoyl-L-alanyl-D-glutamate--2,6-diaminopimelate ligase [Pseudoclavibacter sp. JAI123]NYF14548.1 UDP-N-acetylmuramoyl-L-alanyl-D-glutamate--2,6-diaminopimelate ligase [Pseudoclavibacter sp. JAI123]
MQSDLARPNSPHSVPLTAVADATGGSVSAASAHVEVTGVSSDSRRIRPGDLYVAIPGAQRHGAEFLPAVVRAGAVAVLSDSAGAALAAEHGLPAIVVENPRAVMSIAAATVFGTDTTAPPLFAVTGTNGKTTTSYLLHALFLSLGLKAGLSGTVERIVGDARLETRLSGRLTTPESDYLHGLVARMTEDDVQAAAIEVSSHGLDGARVDGLPFESAIFTNLSQDHLDVYGTLENYFASKLTLFTPRHAKRGVIAIEDEWGRRAAREAQIPVVTVARDTAEGADIADWLLHIDAEGLERTDFTLRGPNGEELSSSIGLPGAFTALDLSLAIVAVIGAGLASLEEIREALAATDGLHPVVPGRLDLVSGDSELRVYVDYGHTAASFRAVLHALRPFTPGRLFMIFGADGDRDKGKRPEMARAASEESDVVIVTDYNPRTEDPDDIRRTLIQTIRAEFPERELYEIADSATGINHAIAMAEVGDLIFIGGHGHRADVEVDGRIVPYSAREAAASALREHGWLQQQGAPAAFTAVDADSASRTQRAS